MPMDNINEAATCLVVIQGVLDPSWADYLGDLTMFTQVTADQTTSTILSGSVADFAAFVGLIARLQNLGLSVQQISFRRLPSQQPT